MTREFEGKGELRQWGFSCMGAGERGFSLANLYPFRYLGIQTMKHDKEETVDCCFTSSTKGILRVVRGVCPYVNEKECADMY